MKRTLVYRLPALLAFLTLFPPCSAAFSADQPEAVERTFYRFCDRGEVLYVCGFFSVQDVKLSETRPTLMLNYESDQIELDPEVHEVARAIGVLVIRTVEALPEGKREKVVGLSLQADKLSKELEGKWKLGPRFVGRRVDVTIHKIETLAVPEPPEPKKQEEPSKAASRRGRLFVSIDRNHWLC